MGARSSRNTTQNNRSDGHLLEYFRNTFVRGGGAAPPVPFSATGGTISTPGDGKIYHTFSHSPSPQSFVSTKPIPGSFFILVAGGGGGAGIGSVVNYQILGDTDI